MPSSIKRLTQASITLSVFNILAWAFDWGRFGFNYFGPSFWALFPQIGLTIWFALLLKNYDRFLYRMFAPIIGFSLWVFTVLISNIEYFTTKETIPWSLTYSILDSIGFPILEIEYGGIAPLFGLFHSNQGDLNVISDWYFDGGITFSWFFLNIFSLIVLLAMARIAFQDRNDVNLRWKS